MDQGGATIIRRIKGTRRLGAIPMHLSVEGTKGGEKAKERIGEYTREVYPGTIQVKRAPYDINGTRMWLFKKQDGSFYTQEEFQELQDNELHLTYGKYHRKAGDVIDKVNIYSSKCPFFSHNFWDISFNEGEHLVQDNEKAKEVKIAALRAHQEVKDDQIEGRTASQKFELSSTQQDSDKQAEIINKEVEAIKLWSNLSDKKVRQVLSALGHIVSKDSDIVSLKNTLYTTYVDKTSATKEAVDKFIGIAKADPEELIYKDMINRAVRTKIIKKGGVKKPYQYNGNIVGRTPADIEDYFRNVENYSDLESLEADLKE